MAAVVLRQFNIAVQKLETTIAVLLGRRFPPESYCISPAVITNYEQEQKTENLKSKFSLADIFGDGFLWASPRNRRTVEKRWKRKFGFPELNWKMIVPKSNLRVCNSCGNNHEVGVLCAHCYEKVLVETQAMKAQVEAELGLDPIDKEVVVLYDGEKAEQPDEFWEGKRIVEMKKPRPIWFSKNLLQKTTQQPALTTDVKPTELA